MYRFGLFEFDPASGGLRRDGRAVRLQPQPARMLAVLVSRAGELVTRDELRQALWGPQTFVEFDRALNFCAGQVRAALGDAAASPRYIETVPKRGYRFIAPTERVPTAAGHPEASLPVAQPPLHRSRRLVPLVAMAILAVVLVAAAWRFSSFRPTATASAPPTVIVVPFANETGAADLDQLAKGLSDVTVARLATAARLPQLRVIGNAADLRFSFGRRDLKAMGDRLGAGYIVLGQLKRDDRQLRIVAHLIRVSDQTHLWANTFDRAQPVTLADQAGVAEAIAAAVASSLASARSVP
jgi:TolB-like protein/DNA-binding winged helix-turn-helix (wHTH) protein